MKSILGKLEFTVARELVIRAPRTTVFRYFTDSERWAKWWGSGSTIDGRAGGAVKIVYPGATVASGEVLEIRPPERIVFSYGYEGAGKPIAPGASRVTIQLAEHALGTKLTFLHEVADGPTRDHHLQGWRYQLAVFANVVANEAHAGAAAQADRWFAAWNEADAGARSRAFAALVAKDVLFTDAYSCTRGLDDLDAHVSGAKVHMPGITLARAGEPRHCQGTALVDWIAKKGDGSQLSKGTSVFEFTADGRIARVVGFWG
jgi:uncharacterized protein YndB with AHSA1/START domain